MHKPKKLVEWDFEKPEVDGEKHIIDLYKKMHPDVRDEFNNLVEVVNRLVDNANRVAYPQVLIHFEDE